MISVHDTMRGNLMCVAISLGEKQAETAVTIVLVRRGYLKTSNGGLR